MKKIISLSILAFILVGCNYAKKDANSYSDNNKLIDDIVISPPNVKSSIVMFDSIFSGYRIINLDNNLGDNLVGEISSIYFYAERIYVLDKKISKSITVYDINGNFLYKIGKRGNGPGEYIKLESLIFNKNLKRIEVFDSEQQKIIFFNLKGEFLSEIKTPVNFFEFFYDNKSRKYYFYSKFLPNEYGNYRLFIADEYFNILKGYLPFENEMIGAQVISMDNFYEHNDSFFFYGIL